MFSTRIFATGSVLQSSKRFVLLVPSLTTIPAHSVGAAAASLADRREDILAAIGYLFFGV